ncbi:toxin VasX [Marinobacter sediminum]|uniref:toxin VasX n=1 Tax=Marinobacter sediminum TaxID=256323 RepID=UPI0030845ECA
MLSFNDETLGNAIRRRADYDDQNRGTMVLAVPRRAGGHIHLPLIEKARSNIEQDEHQENTLLRIKPLAELTNNLPVKSGGLTFHTGKGVALLRPGYLYVFRGKELWRELEVDAAGLMSDVDLSAVRQSSNGAEQTGNRNRVSEGEWLSNILVPVLLQGRAVLSEIRVAFSEVQWDWAYIRRLEENATSRQARTTGIDHAWPAATLDELVFDKGYPASKITNVQGIRGRDLGIELMLEDPAEFLPDFEVPNARELCMRVKHRLTQIAEEDQPPLNMDLHVGQGEDLLQDLRDQKGVVCVSIPDPLFQLRHSLSQLHLALHYLDAVDVSLKQKPMAHSAMLIRQAVFDPLTLDRKTDLQKYADAINKDKLDEVLDTKEKDHAVAVIDRHVERLQEMMKSSVLEAVLNDYCACTDVAICEGYLLIADQLNLLQQIPGVMRANGVARDYDLFKSLKGWLFNSGFLAAWAPQKPGSENSDEVSDTESRYHKLQQLTEDSSEITEEMLDRLNLQSLAYLEKQLHEREEGATSIAKNIQDAGKVGNLVIRSLEEWCTAVLKVCERLIEEGTVNQVQVQRVMASAVSNFTLADPSLAGISIVSRGGVESSGTILGVRGEGLTRGLTEFDRTEGILTRKNDYLYADLVDDSGAMLGSTSPTRAADEMELAIQKAAGHASVFYAPAGHAEARKLSLIKVDIAEKAKDIVDGPAVSRGLVVLAAFNVFVEARASIEGIRQGNEQWPLLLSKFVSAAVDLTAASFKLAQVLGQLGGAQVSNARQYRIATRPLFDVKNWFFIGNRLRKVGAPSLVRVVGLASFVAGAVTAVLSCAEMALGFHNRDFDAAIGHAVAFTGGLIYVAHPLMATLLSIPGWGWALLGMSLVLGGSLYANNVADDAFEKLIKRGPLGLYPKPSQSNVTDDAYFAQLMTLMSPIVVDVQTYQSVAKDLEFSRATQSPDPEDYVVTVRMPLVSRLMVSSSQLPGTPHNSFNLLVQEVAYTSASIDTHGPAGKVENQYIASTTPLRKVVARQSLPDEGGVRFLVKRQLENESRSYWGYDEAVWTTVRVGVQAVVRTELGSIVLPTPVNDEYEPFELSRHGNPPAKGRFASDPLAQPDAPYWFFTEEEV